jgi:hypothetical protein
VTHRDFDEYSPKWPSVFEKERERLRSVLGVGLFGLVQLRRMVRDLGNALLVLLDVGACALTGPGACVVVCLAAGAWLLDLQLPPSIMRAHAPAAGP